MNNPFETISAFKNIVQSQHGQNFNPSTMANNMLGQNCQTPQQALQLLFQSGKISKQQYDMFSKMM